MKKVITSAVLISLMSAGLILNNRGLEVRDVLNENYTNEVTGKVVNRKLNEVATNKLSEVKAQISSVLENGKRHIRFVAALDSYLYDSVNFTITANNGSETKTLVNNESVNRVYTYIESNGNLLSASEAFGDGYNYFVAYTINNVPESAWGYTFSATVTAQAEGYTEVVSSSADRVINNMINDEMEKEVPVITYDTSKRIYSGSIDNILDGDNSTYVWFEGTPSYIDFTFSKETYIDSLEIVFVDGYGQDNLSSPPKVSYYDSSSDTFIELGEIPYNTWTMELNSNFDSITTSKIRLHGEHRAWVSVAEFRYNFKDNVTLNGVKNYRHGSSASLFDNNPNSTLLIEAPTEVNGHIDIELEENTQLKSIEITTVERFNGLPRIQYLSENGEYITITEKAESGCKIDLRNDEIYTSRVRLTTLQDDIHYQNINYRDIVINGVTDDTPLLRLEGSSQEIYSGSALDVFDGDDSTFLWTGFAPKANDAYVITYPNPITLKNLYVNYKNQKNNEVIVYDKIAYRLDNTTEWVDLDVTVESEDGSFFLDLSDNTIENVKEIKLYTSKDLDLWGALSTFDVNYGAYVSPNMIEHLYDSFNEGRFVSSAFDRDDYTYCWFGNAVGSDDYLVIDLGQTRRISSLSISMYHKNHDNPSWASNFVHMEYSLDGINWSNKIYMDSIEFTYNFDRIASVRYVRLAGESITWPSVSSVSVKSAF